MSPRDPFKLEKLSRRLDNLQGAFKDAAKRPPIGITQGGSSRKFAGARPAANNGQLRQPKRKS